MRVPVLGGWVAWLEKPAKCVSSVVTYAPGRYSE
jgi:hypothetical protein